MSRSGLLPNPHPGEILLEEFLKPMELSQNALARSIHVAPRRINEISRAISVYRKGSFSGCRWTMI
jgi:addiction module HigA family antidote